MLADLESVSASASAVEQKQTSSQGQAAELCLSSVFVLPLYTDMLCIILFGARVHNHTICL